MAQKPMLDDHVAVIMQLFELFIQHRIQQQDIKQANLLTCSTTSFVIIFMLTQFHRIYTFKFENKKISHVGIIKVYVYAR